jgi:threonine dehydratase
VTDSYARSHLGEIEAARARIAGHVRRTPLLATDLDPSLRLKPECLQVTGSFKPRGAFNAVLRLRERQPEATGVIAASSGNHAQAVALAARELGLRAVILIPEDASPVKVAGTRALGAEVLQEGITLVNREERLRSEAAARGMAVVHPFDDWEMIHGHASAALEALEDDPELGAFVVPIGGGGLVSGIALAVKATRPAVRVIGVEPAAADDARRSFESRTLQRLGQVPQTVADGVRPMAIGTRPFEVLIEHGLLDDVITVGEEEILDATRAAWLGGKVVVEPTGALPLAAWRSGQVRAEGPVALLLSGGNADPRLMARVLDPGSAKG